VLCGVCLAIGPLVTRNIIAGLAEGRQRRWATFVIALYLALSILSSQFVQKLERRDRRMGKPAAR
jgi:SSS family solute:Na+ symporter